MTTGMVQDQNLEKQIEKQMGCMAGFLHIFDRHQILAGKRLYSAKRLPPSVILLIIFHVYGWKLRITVLTKMGFSETVGRKLNATAGECRFVTGVIG